MKGPLTYQQNFIAGKQGWGVFVCDDGRISIQRIDDPKNPDFNLNFASPRFGCDEAAAAYVVGRADAGCAVARKALTLLTPPFSIGAMKNWDMGVA